MNRFRVQENVPDVYTKFSRDFQLICNLYDIVYNGVRFDIDTMKDVTDTTMIRDSLLEYLQTKLGFFTTTRFTTDTLRRILLGFKDMVRWKGTAEGIRRAISIYLKTQGISEEPLIFITNNNSTAEYTIEIKIEATQLSEIEILYALLDYAAPTSYRITTASTRTPDLDSTNLEVQSLPSIGYIMHESNSSVHNSKKTVTQIGNINTEGLSGSRVSTSGVNRKDEIQTNE